MEIKLIKYWKVELFEEPKVTASAINGILPIEERSPFLTGYSNTQFDLRKAVINGEEFITLCCDPGSLQTRSVRISRIHEFKCTPIYESDDTFQEAAKPLMKWLVENVHQHHQAIVTSSHAELLESQYVVKTEEFLKG
ncbi:TPA_asm: hypothetical protein G0G78_26965 [Salmonella enterica]|nr:hypothetical protein [Salmonella enterica]EAO7619086.1 hypothetical protein [Salmonella enterica]EAQ6819696.1 hypothetical protein [Salmonella enterica]HAC8240018.1 hypothetical protein [Salmonella enterica]HAC8273594.1 hypothetical protein [Salmonella enterica]